MGLDRRPLTPGDAGDWAALLTAIQDTDGSDDYVSEQDLRETFDDPSRDFPRGSVAIYDGRTMAGYGVLVLRGVAEPEHAMLHEGGVHPAYRGRGLGGELLDWAERTAIPLHHERFPARPMSLTSACLAANAAAVALHEQRGFRPARWFHDMVRDLSAPIPAAVTDRGITITGYEPGMAEHARLIRNESFRDHWGSEDRSPQAWAHFLAADGFRPQFSFLAYQGAEPLGMLMSREQDRAGRRDLYISLVGTRAAGRKRGIATALLVAAMAAARAARYDQASLGVDADSLTEAVRLYERVGFTVTHTWTAFRKHLT